MAGEVEENRRGVDGELGEGWFYVRAQISSSQAPAGSTMAGWYLCVREGWKLLGVYTVIRESVG